MYSVKFELPMASFFKYICSFFARNFVVGFMLQCFYVPILFSRLFLRSKSVQKCSTAQSFTFPKFTSFKLGTLALVSELLGFGNPFFAVLVWIPSNYGSLDHRTKPDKIDFH